MDPTLSHQLTPGPGWTSIVEAVGTAVSGFVLLVGAAFAQRYVKRASASVDASVFERPGGLGLHVRPRIRSSSLVRLELSDEEGAVPTVSVTEYQLRDGALVVGEPASRDTFTGEKVVDPGETITDSEIFLVTTGPETLGWRVRFLFAVKKWPGDKLWWWAATTFVPTPGTAPPDVPAAEAIQPATTAILESGGDG